MLSQNIFPLGKPRATSHFLGKITARSAAGPSAQRMSDVFLQSRASSLVQGFENAAPAWPVQAQPCVSPHFSESSVVQNLSHHARSAAGPSARRMSDVFSQFLASLLMEGFENATQVWIVQAKPCVPLPSALSVSIRAIRGSFSLPYERLDQLFINRKSWTPA